VIHSAGIFHAWQAAKPIHGLTVERCATFPACVVRARDGKIDGDKISFKVSFNGMTITHEGTVNTAGDEIKLNSKSDSGDFPAMEFTLKRVKAPPAAGM